MRFQVQAQRDRAGNMVVAVWGSVSRGRALEVALAVIAENKIQLLPDTKPQVQSAEWWTIVEGEGGARLVGDTRRRAGWRRGRVVTFGERAATPAPPAEQPEAEPEAAPAETTMTNEREG